MISHSLAVTSFAYSVVNFFWAYAFVDPIGAFVPCMFALISLYALKRAMESGEYSLLSAYVGVSALCVVYNVCLLIYSIYANIVYKQIWTACTIDPALETSQAISCTNVRTMPFDSFGLNWFVNLLFIIPMLVLSSYSVHMGNLVAKQIAIQGVPSSVEFGVPVSAPAFASGIVVGTVVGNPSSANNSKLDSIETGSPTSTAFSNRLNGSPVAPQDQESMASSTENRTGPRSQYHRFD